MIENWWHKLPFAPENTTFSPIIYGVEGKHRTIRLGGRRDGLFLFKLDDVSTAPDITLDLSNMTFKTQWYTFELVYYWYEGHAVLGRLVNES